MSNSRVPAVLAYLVTAFQNAATLGQATPPVNVIDGPQVTASPGPLALWVGAEDIDPSVRLPAAAASTQQWQPGLRPPGAPSQRTEQITVYCVAQAVSGSDDITPLRAQAAAIRDAAENLIGGDPTLGGTLTGGTADALLADCGWRQGPTEQGTAVQVTFSITASALISTP